MKALILTALFSTAGFAQTLDINALKGIMIQRQAQLETVTPGMSKLVTSKGSFSADSGEECTYTSTATQTILKLQGENLIMFSQENFVPDQTDGCAAAEAQAFETKILYYEKKPTLSQDLASLDAAASDLISLVKQGEIVTMTLNLKATQDDGTVLSDLVTVKYDLSKPSFKNLILNSGSDYSITTQESADIDPMTVDLSDVLFCDNNDGDTSECVPGNYSDILY